MSEYSSEKQWISFNIGKETYALPVMMVREVVEYEEPVPVPGAPVEVEGVLNHRGEVISVVSGHRLLNERNKEPGRLWRIMVMETTEGLLGMSVDLVREIILINPDEIHHESSKDSADCVLGTVRCDEDLVILMDVATAVQELAVPRGDI